MRSQPTVSLTLIKLLLLYAEEIGVDLGTTWQEEANRWEQGARIPAGQYYSLWSALEKEAGDPDLGLHLVETTQSHWGGDLLAVVMLNSPTVGTAMERLSCYHALTTDFIQIKLHRRANIASYVIHSPFQNGLLNRHVAEAAIGRVFTTLKNLSSGKLLFLEVHFRHPKPERTHEHRRIFETSICFNATEDAILLHMDGLGIPIPLADQNILQPLEAVAKSQLVELYPPERWSDRVTHSIGENLLRGKKPNLSIIAEAFAISPRQLQKHLKEEGITYRILFERVRKEIALDWLAKPGVTLYDVAFLLGFSDQSAFNHAFKRWTGSSPGAYQSCG